MEKSLIEIYNSTFDKPPYIAKTKAFKPSSLGGKCMRKLFYSYTRTLPDFEFAIENKRIKLLGDAIHTMLAEGFREKKVLLDYYGADGHPKINYFTKKPDYEFPIEEASLEIKAKLDAVLLLDGEIWIGEYKSIKGTKFAELKGPAPEHVIQANLYYFLLRNAIKENQFAHIKELKGYTEQDVKGIKFIYYNKDNSQMKEYEITGDFDLFCETLDKMDKIKTHVAEKTLPDKAKEFCDYCEYRLKCVNNSIN